MDVGVTLFLNDRCIDPARLAREVEARGFSSLWIPEHTHLPVREADPPALVGGVNAGEYRRTLDPFVALATAGAVTERLVLGTGVSLVAQHHPITLAKQVATLDHLTGGRVSLGVGYGWNRTERDDHGVSHAERREVVAEHVRCMRVLWTEEEAEFHGDRVEFGPSYAWPKPVQRPLPVLLGGGPGPKLFDAVAAWADGWMPIGGAGLSRNLPRLRKVVADAGRDPDSMRVVPFGVLPDTGKLEHYRELGVSEVVLRVPAGSDDEVLATLDHHAVYAGAPN